MQGLQLLDDTLLDDLIARARATERLRLNHNFHAGPDDNPHRFLNALIRGTYVCPHRHTTPPKDEAFLVLRGEIGIAMFAGDGEVVAKARLGGPGQPTGLDLAAGIFHTLVPLSDAAVIYEVKPGPWDPATDKDWAPWAPREGEPGVADYLRELESIFTQP